MEDQEFAEFPEEFLDQIAQRTYGGFILFFADANGNPQVITDFNEASDAISLKKFALDILTSLDLISRQQMLNDLTAEAARMEGGEEE